LVRGWNAGEAPVRLERNDGIAFAGLTLPTGSRQSREGRVKWR